MPEGQQEQRAESARLVPGVRLLGEYQGSGFVEPRYLVARSDGQLLHVSRLLFLVASALRESVSPTSAAQQVSAAYGRTLTPDGLVLLVEHKLQPMGLACVDRPAHPRAAVPPAPGPPSAPALRSKPLLALRFRRVLLSQGATRVVAAALAPLFTPVVVVALVGSLLATDTWLVRSASLDTAVADTLRTPPVMLLLLAILLGSTLFHEFGHAAACRYGGGDAGGHRGGPVHGLPGLLHRRDPRPTGSGGRPGAHRPRRRVLQRDCAARPDRPLCQTAYAPLLLAIALVAHRAGPAAPADRRGSTGTSSSPTSWVSPTCSAGWVPSCRASCPAVQASPARQRAPPRRAGRGHASGCSPRSR